MIESSKRYAWDVSLFDVSGFDWFCTTTLKGQVEVQPFNRYEVVQSLRCTKHPSWSSRIEQGMWKVNSDFVRTEPWLCICRMVFQVFSHVQPEHSDCGGGSILEQTQPVSGILQGKSSKDGSAVGRKGLKASGEIKKCPRVNSSLGWHCAEFCRKCGISADWGQQAFHALRQWVVDKFWSWQKLPNIRHEKQVGWRLPCDPQQHNQWPLKKLYTLQFPERGHERGIPVVFWSFLDNHLHCFWIVLVALCWTCCEVIDVRQNVLVMDFLGQDSTAAPRLKDKSSSGHGLVLQHFAAHIARTMRQLYCFRISFLVSEDADGLDAAAWESLYIECAVLMRKMCGWLCLEMHRTI